jgi:phenylacetaldehyde dehydrogenase
MGIFINAGQGCVCGSRIYAHRRVYQQVLDGIAGTAKGLKLGGSADANADIGPLISAKQRDRVTGLVAEGQRDGATVVTGGRPLNRAGFFFEPTVVTQVRSDMRMMREEIFGPVVAITPFDDEEAVIAEANNTEYGLAAAIWTRDIGRAHRLAKHLQAGNVWLNCQLASDASVPFGGYEQSGWGHEYGWKGIEAYLQSKSVFADLA